MMAAISLQSTLLLPDVSRWTPSQLANTPRAEVAGLKNRSGSASTSSSWAPGGAGHHKEMRPSPVNGHAPFRRVIELAVSRSVFVTVSFPGRACYRVQRHWTPMRRLVVKALEKTDEALDWVLYRPAVVKAFLWVPRWWQCDLAKLSIRLDDRWGTGVHADEGLP